MVREGRKTYEPVNGCHTGMMDLSQVDLPVDATYYRDPAARRAAALTCERRPDRLCWNAGRPDRRVDRLTPTRHRPDTATRRMSLLLPSGTGWEQPPAHNHHGAAATRAGLGRHRRCRFPNPVSSPDRLTCGYSSCLTPCHRAFVSNSCHFLSGTDVLLEFRLVAGRLPGLLSLVRVEALSVL